MIQHCKNCSKCCEVIAIDHHTHEKLMAKINSGVVDPVYKEMLEPISNDEAFHRNPDLYLARKGAAQAGGAEVSFYSCKQLKDNKCGIYDRRPTMCSGYPFYGRYKVDITKHSDLCRQQYLHKEISYSKTCTYVPTLIPVRNI